MSDNERAYETKCRRCGAINNHVHPNFYHWSQWPSRQEYDMKLLMLQCPNELDCGNCKQPTIQDVVAFNGPDKNPHK